jgi:hypothetical protein
MAALKEINDISERLCLLLSGWKKSQSENGVPFNSVAFRLTLCRQDEFEKSIL